MRVFLDTAYHDLAKLASADAWPEAERVFWDTYQQLGDLLAPSLFLSWVQDFVFAMFQSGAGRAVADRALSRARGVRNFDSGDVLSIVEEVGVIASYFFEPDHAYMAHILDGQAARIRACTSSPALLRLVALPGMPPIIGSAAFRDLDRYVQADGKDVDTSMARMSHRDREWDDSVRDHRRGVAMAIVAKFASDAERMRWMSFLSRQSST